MAAALAPDDQMAMRLLSTATALTRAAERAQWGTLAPHQRCELARELRALADALDGP